MLVRLAGDLPLAAYVKSVILRGESLPEYRKVTVDRELAARALAILGQSGIGINLARLADHAASGSLELDDRTWNRIHEACEDVQAVRELLMEALGKKQPSDPLRAAESFRRAAR